MAHRTVHRLTCLVLLLAISAKGQEKEQTRWSRQLSSQNEGLGGWVPLPASTDKEPEHTQSQHKRQSVAEPRILSEAFPGAPRPTAFNPDPFSSRNYFNTPANRQLYLQSVPSVPSAPQNFLSDQGFNQGFRFGLSQPNFNPLNQAFVAQPFSYENVPPQQTLRQQGIPVNPVSFPQASGLPHSIKSKPFLNVPQKTKQDLPKFVEGYRVENISFGTGPKKKPQSLQKIKFESGERIKQDVVPNRAKNERGEEVQLLYVPLEQLNRGQFNFRSPITSPQLLNTELYSQGLPRPNPGKQTFLNEYQRPPVQTHDSFAEQNFFSDFNSQLKDVDQVPRYTTHTTPFATYAPTTPRSKKLKPHQPPLAIFTLKDPTKNSPVKVGDVLSSLKNAETIAVLDSVNPLSAPKVFIGPSNLPPPQNFVKFELPYLSNIEHSDNKLKQMPFFVAPLSYNTPNGFAKIPFPSPHVGSVVINSYIKDSPPTRGGSPSSQPDPNYYTATSPAYKPELKSTTQKTTFSYYSTATPKTKSTPDFDSNYYSFEPQTVSSIRPLSQPETQTAPSKTGSYFLSNAGTQYSSQEFGEFPENGFKPSEPIAQPNFPRQPERARITTTTKRPSTYPNQLLETHNPYSINQAFHFSTPLDYHNFFEDVKQPQDPSGSARPQLLSPSSTAGPSTPDSRPIEKTKHQQQSSPSYLNNYNPEIHYNSDQNQVYNADKNTNSGINSHHAQANHHTNVNTDSVNQYNNGDSGVNSHNSDTYNTYSTNNNIPANQYNTDDYNKYNTDTSIESFKTDYNTSPVKPQSPSEINNLPTITDSDSPTKYDEYNNYEATLGVNNPSSAITPTTTTRRSPIKTRSRPRYTTTPRTDSYESSTTRTTTTRRPIRERRPPTTRPRYEPNKISTESPIRKPLDSIELSTNSPRSRTRGHVQYKPSEEEEIYEKRKSNDNKKDADLAYQRDILHQNYPVTLTERMTTRNIEAETEPTLKESLLNTRGPQRETIDTENAYTNEKASVHARDEVKDVSAFTARSTLQTEAPYVPHSPSTQNEELYYPSGSSVAPIEPSSYDDTLNDKDEDIYVKHTTPIPKQAISTEGTVTERKNLKFNEHTTVKQEELTITPEAETAKVESQEVNTEPEENLVQTTPSYNRVRVRPGVIRQYHPATSTDLPKPKESQRRKPSQPVTYRPAFDRRRTTMRIDEIEAGLKTKQVHVRPEQERRHPIYKPEPSTESSVTVRSSTESTTKRNNYRRRRPSYTTTSTSTESSSTKRIYDVKNRFRGRRPSEKSTEKQVSSTETPSSTTRNLIHSRYSQRPRLSERYNKKPEPQEEDQESNYSFNRPRYVERSDQWSPKISGDSFKPYNPNDIADEQKIETTERRSDTEMELDIITARNEYEDILLTVTPATNNRMIKKIPDIPPTLEAFVEQSKVTKSDSGDSMSTFESMLEEVMKSLEEQDQDEYSSNVMKHKGGEIGEIPPERVISSEESYTLKSTTPLEETTTEQTTEDDSPLLDEDDQPNASRRRGFWKKVKVRPVTTESIEFAESQYYVNTVNTLGQPVNTKAVNNKFEKSNKLKVTTYKPKFQFLTDLFSIDNDDDDVEPTIDIFKINNKKTENEESYNRDESYPTTVSEKDTTTLSPGDFDLGTGSPDGTTDDTYITTTTELSITTERADTFSFMDYFFGATSEDSEKNGHSSKNVMKTSENDVKITTEQPKSKTETTETAFMPEEITESSINEDTINLSELGDNITTNATERFKIENSNPSSGSDSKVESSSVSSFMDPLNILSTSMSTEISHETEICFRGKCIKTSKDIL